MAHIIYSWEMAKRGRLRERERDSTKIKRRSPFIAGFGCKSRTTILGLSRRHLLLLTIQFYWIGLWLHCCSCHSIISNWFARSLSIYLTCCGYNLRNWTEPYSLLPKLEEGEGRCCSSWVPWKIGPNKQDPSIQLVESSSGHLFPLAPKTYGTVCTSEERWRSSDQPWWRRMGGGSSKISGRQRAGDHEQGVG